MSGRYRQLQALPKVEKHPGDLQLIAAKNFRYCSASQFIHFTNRLKDQSLTTKFQVLCLANHFHYRFVHSVVRK